MDRVAFEDTSSGSSGLAPCDAPISTHTHTHTPVYRCPFSLKSAWQP